VNTMKNWTLIILILGVALFLDAQDHSKLMVKSIGKAAPSVAPASKARAVALRAAKIEGYRKLAEAAGLSKVYRDGNKKYRRVDTILKGARVVKVRYLTDHKAEVTMEMPRLQLSDIIKTIKKQIYGPKIFKVKQRIKTLQSQIQTLKMELQSLTKTLKHLEEKCR
jgi:hypothetical protein